MSETNHVCVLYSVAAVLSLMCMLCVMLLFPMINVLYVLSLGTAVAQRLKCRATNRKVAGSIPDGVIVIFH